MQTSIAIVGGGIAGLTCARTLAQSGQKVAVFEAADAPGGRVRTDEHEGFRLDRGFQVFLTAYPEAQRLLDYTQLDLRPFYHGAEVFAGGKLHRVGDPWRHPWDGMMGLLTPVGGVSDKLQVARLRSSVLESSLESLLARPERTTAEALRASGFSPSMIDRFFRPFYGGVFLERELATSSRFFEFTFRMFACGDAAVPASGMEAIPRQLAAGLDVRTGARVASVAEGRLTLDSGETVAADRIVLATNGLDSRLPAPAPQGWNGTTCLYFAAPEPPAASPVLLLNGSGSGRVNHAVVMSAASPAYAPPGQALISVSLIGAAAEPDAALSQSVLAELEAWFPNRTKAWRLLRIYRIPEALPRYTPPAAAGEPYRRLEPWLFACGDSLTMPSLNFAMQSGRRAAEAVLAS